MLAIACACMPLVIGAAGLATDTIEWTLWKRQLQRAADSAAFAGVYDRSAASGATTNTPTAVCNDLAMNVHTWMTLIGTSPCTGSVGSYTQHSISGGHCVRDQPGPGDAEVQQRLPFSSLFVSTAPMIAGHARPPAVCPRAAHLHAGAGISTRRTAINNNGNTTVTAPTCILYSDSAASNAASAGGSSSVTAKAIAAVGGISRSNNWNVSHIFPIRRRCPIRLAPVDTPITTATCTARAAGAGTRTRTCRRRTLGTHELLLVAGSTQPSDSIDLTSGLRSTARPLYINGGNVDLQGDFTCALHDRPDQQGPGVECDDRHLVVERAGDEQHHGADVRHLQGHRGLPGPPRRRATPTRINGGSNNVIKGVVYFPNEHPGSTAPATSSVTQALRDVCREKPQPDGNSTIAINAARPTRLRWRPACRAAAPSGIVRLIA